MENFEKIINPCQYKVGKYYRQVFCKIEFTDGNLSIVGVVGPLPSGNCYGSCGQIADCLNTDRKLSKEWDKITLDTFLATWEKYHLNDMQSACEHQRAVEITYKKCPDHVCLYCGYKIGSAWLTMAVPDEVLEFLKGLPDSKLKPAWI